MKPWALAIWPSGAVVADPGIGNSGDAEILGDVKDVAVGAAFEATDAGVNAVERDGFTGVARGGVACSGERTLL